MRSLCNGSNFNFGLTFIGVHIMSENYLLEEAIILFTALDEESKNFVVSLLKSEVQQDGHQEQCA